MVRCITGRTTAHVVRYNGVVYDITRINVFEGYKQDLKPCIAPAGQDKDYQKNENDFGTIG